MSKGDREFSCEIDKTFGDFIIEEYGNSSLNLRKVSWNGRAYKLDLRKWQYPEAGEERAMRGVTFSEDGASVLAETLVENGYGDTSKLMEALSKRDDYGDIRQSPESATTYHDPSELFKGGEEVD